ncbi:nitrate reductase molybdenum cofactor assembly chaperone [Paracoccus sp. SCSIO 75233]|uniref:nitrate reductase molybdenum cofactor assembly chaperone n=1 Tax=Paracoccus sp. SCSIO 75233 TaxID=3017782 RepID=UPI0022EFFEF8|nr:nitrate reductase molybdenum cofactor assembly chaperone [Paracoccus sp. SCSIO 75233]WBU53078.1 nitrate reductase molybdenum cofactor assembly chaperone [Paracoccus sp. SCSIO 75233]
MKTFKALSALLSYPSSELIAAIPEIDAVLHAEGLLGPARQNELAPLLQGLTEGDLYDLQERYVLLFDRSRTLSLNLFEHVHGESRDRGGAMVDLLETYRAGGFDLAGTELPDHLPVLLEFLSTRTLDEAKEILADAGHILVALAERLQRRESPYAAVFTALVTIAETDAELPPELADIPDDDPEDLEALDAVWEEAQVTFGPDPNAGCPVSRDILARMEPVRSPAAAE